MLEDSWLATRWQEGEEEELAEAIVWSGIDRVQKEILEVSVGNRMLWESCR